MSLGFASPAFAPTSHPGTKYQKPLVFEDDFLEISISATDGAARWLNTQTGSGTLVGATDEYNGVLHLTTAAADNDHIELQASGNPFAVAADRDIIFEARLKLTAAASPLTTIDWFVGLATKDTDVGGGVNDMIGFGTGDGTNGILNAGGASIYAYTGDDTSSWATAQVTDTDTGVDYVDDTYFRIRFEVLGGTVVKFYVDNVLKATHTTEIPDEGAFLTPTILLQNNAAAAKQMQIDYIVVTQPRKPD